MGLLDKLRSKAGGKAGKLGETIDKVADKVDEKTGGKHTDKIEKGVGKAKDALDKLDGDDDK